MDRLKVFGVVTLIVVLGASGTNAGRKRVKEDRQAQAATEGALKFSYLVSKDTNQHKAENSDTTSDLEKWRAPSHIQRQFPYTFGGYDTKDRPVWIVPYGKYNIPKVTEEGGENLKALEKWLAQFSYRVEKSREARSKPGRKGTETLFLLDFDGVDAEKFAHLPPFLMSMAPLERGGLRPESSFNNGITVIINANEEVSNLLSLTRSAFGREMERVEVYGTNRRQWLPKLSKHFPRYTLPSQYGGRRDFKPVASYGRK